MLIQARPKHGVSRSVVDLHTTTNRYLAQTNRSQALLWTARTAKAMPAIDRGQQR